jgi:hypothetical protein
MTAVITEILEEVDAVKQQILKPPAKDLVLKIVFPKCTEYMVYRAVN